LTKNNIIVKTCLFLLKKNAIIQRTLYMSLRSLKVQARDCGTHISVV
jgi:hypothetical protein